MKTCFMVAWFWWSYDGLKLLLKINGNQHKCLDFRKGSLRITLFCILYRM